MGQLDFQKMILRAKLDFCQYVLYFCSNLLIHSFTFQWSFIWASWIWCTMQC